MQIVSLSERLTLKLQLKLSRQSAKLALLALSKREVCRVEVIRLSFSQRLTFSPCYRNHGLTDDFLTAQGSVFQYGLHFLLKFQSVYQY